MTTWLFLLLATAHATYPPPGGNGCTNEDCLTQGANLVSVGLLIGATVAPVYLAPGSSANFLTRKKGDVVAGGLIGGSATAAIQYDFVFPEAAWGLRTSLSLSRLKDSTNLAYRLMADHGWLLTPKLRASVATGIAVEKFMEGGRLFVGPPLELSLEAHLSDRWKSSLVSGVYFLRTPVYREELRFFRRSIGARDAWMDLTFGYRFESNQDDRTHFVLLGFTI